MIIRSCDFNIAKIAESGQCFRLTENIDGSYGLIHKGKYLNIRQIIPGSGRSESLDSECMDSESMDSGYLECELDCSEGEYCDIWADYFDMTYDYQKVRLAADVNDQFLLDAVGYGRGIRILRQDPWEMLISFIISQRKSIPAIRSSIEKLCALCGERIETLVGFRYTFPSPEAVAALSMKQLEFCSLGYRSKYIKEVADKAARGELDVYGLDKLPNEELRNALLALFGVGVKVADCVMLFGYHRLDAFPADVWIKRAMENEYPEGFPYEKYSGFAGIMQQYIFFYMRRR